MVAANDEPVEIEQSWRDGPIGKDLKRVRKRQAALVEIRHHWPALRWAASTCG